MRLRAFNGGLATRLDARLIKESEAREYININSDTAVLTPIKDKTEAVSSINRYSYYFAKEDTWYSSATPVDWLEYKEILYKADRINAPVKILGGTEYNLGIEAPSGTVTVTVYSAPEAIERVDLAADFNASADLPEGTYKYKVVNRSSTTGLKSYSYFRIPVEEVTVKPRTRGGRPYNTAGSTTAGTKYGTFKNAVITSGENRVTLSFDDTNADEVRVYRYFDSTWRAVNAFQDSSIAVIDSIYDISANDELDDDEGITGIIQYAITYYNSSDGTESSALLLNEVEIINGYVELTNIPVSSDPQVDKVRIYRIGGNLTAFSLVDTINNGFTTYTDTIADTDIVGTILSSIDNDPAPIGLKYLVEAYAMFFGALGDKLRFTPIGNPDAWPTNYFLDFPAEITGISKTAIGLLVHTHYKTYLVTGTGPTAFAQQILAGDQGCISHDTIQETKDTALWLSTDGICASDGSDVKVISRDKLGKQLYNPVNAILYDQVYQVQLANGSVVALDFDRGIFKQFNYDVNYLVTANDNLYGHKDGKLYQLNIASSFLSMSYVSPDFAGNGLTEPKIYTDVEFYSTGSITITVRINDIDVLTVTKTTSDSHQIKIPQDKKRGFYIAFKIEGTGEVRELMWSEATANG